MKTNENRIHLLLKDMNLVDNNDQDSDIKIIEKFFDELPSLRDGQMTDVMQQIDIVLSQTGDIVLATSKKIPNLKFRLGEFLPSILNLGVGLLSNDDAIKLTKEALVVLLTILNLTIIEISLVDAELLLSIYSLSKDEKKVTTDNLIEYLGANNKIDLPSHLGTLERLGCISLFMNGIFINETIVFRHKDS